MEDDETFVEGGSDNADIIGDDTDPEYFVGQQVLWFDKDQRKVNFPWRRGVVTKVLGKNAYRVVFENKRIRTVNASALVADRPGIEVADGLMFNRGDIPENVHADMHEELHADVGNPQYSDSNQSFLSAEPADNSIEEADEAIVQDGIESLNWINDTQQERTTDVREEQFGEGNGKGTEVVTNRDNVGTPPRRMSKRTPKPPVRFSPS
jgi:hypothetical protein